MESQVWAIAIKGDSSTHALKAETDQYAKSYPFKVPADGLRVGTLDSLMSLSDDLAKMEVLAEATVAKFYKQLQDLVPDMEPTIMGVPVASYTLMNWEWEEAKFRLNAPLRELSEGIAQRIGALDEELKVKMAEVNALRGSLQGIERKTQGNLMVRGLADIIDESIVVESDFMTTMWVIVPKANVKEFVDSYERMATYVVPKSGLLVKEDMEYALYRVIIFRKSLDEFKASAREKRLTLRDFTYDPKAIENDRMKKMQDEGAYEDLKNKLTNRCKINYAEVYTMMLHLKAVRVFVESVLRYGLTPSYGKGMQPNFKAFLLQPKKGQAEKLRKVLGDLYGGASALIGDGEEETVIPGATGEFYPYVYSAIETEPNVGA